MFKPKGLLKVISVIMIIFSVFSVGGIALTYMMMPQYESMGMPMELLEAALTPQAVALTIISALIMMIAGILGVSGKSFRWVVIMGGIYSANLVFNMVRSVITSGFTAFLVLDLIIPLLFWWGIYQSKE